MLPTQNPFRQKGTEGSLQSSSSSQPAKNKKNEMYRQLNKKRIEYKVPRD